MGAENCYFFFACKRHPNTLFDFEDRFGLRHNPADIYEVMDAAREKVIFASDDRQALLDWLDARPDSSFDLYLQDGAGRSFMFSHRPDNLHVLGIPYDLMSEDQLEIVLKRMGAIFGYGWHDDTPLDSLAEIREAAYATNSVFRRYRQGKLIPADL